MTDVNDYLDLIRDMADNWFALADRMVGENRRGRGKWSKREIKAVRATARRLEKAANRHGQFRAGPPKKPANGNGEVPQLKVANGSSAQNVSALRKPRREKSAISSEASTDVSPLPPA